MWALIKKEIFSQMRSSIFYISAALFLFISGFGFVFSITPGERSIPEASLRGVISFMSVVFLFVIPFLTMRSFAEERKSGTLELLKTSPLTDLQIVLGKYFSVLLIIFFMLVLSLHFPVILLIGANPDISPMILSYVGIFLMAATFAAIGIFTSVLVKEQMIAAFLSFVMVLFLWFLADLNQHSFWGWAEKISPITHLEALTLGALDLGDMTYFVVVIFTFLFFAFRFLEVERWK